jgi:hypothetical protein
MKQICFNVPGFVNYKKKGALDSQPQVIKFTSCLPMVGGSLRVLRLLPPGIRSYDLYMCSIHFYDLYV